jgi:hypothetical protein
MRAKRGSAARGVSYIEVLVAVFLVAVALVPALQAVASGLQGARVHADLSQGMAPIVAELEELLARPYPVLYRAAIAGGSAGGSATVAVAPYDPTVALVFPLPATIPAGPGFSDASYDVFIHSIDPATGAAAAGDSGLLQIRIQARTGGATMRAYKARTEVYE